MAETQKARHIDTKTVVSLVLSFAAGCVDSIGFLAIYHFFVANMTGNTVHFAQNLLQLHWHEAGMAAILLAAFVLGSILGRTAIEVASRIRVRSVASATLFSEAALIALVVPLTWRHAVTGSAAFGLMALLAAAMGIQTATLTRIGSLTVHTTFVTGMLNKLAQLLAQGLFLSYDLRRGRDVAAARRLVLAQAAFIFFIWLLYLLGAAMAVELNSIWSLAALFVPAGLVAGIIVVDQIAPLSIEEERDQPER